MIWNSICTALSHPCLFPVNRLSALPSKYGTGTNVHAFAPMLTNVRATVLAQTSTKKLASASASKLKTHAALNRTQFSTRKFALAQTLAVLTPRHATPKLYPTLIREPANANATGSSSLLTKTRKEPMPAAMQSKETSDLMKKSADANAVLLKRIVTSC